MRAIIFDIDGTLALNAEADGPCFAEGYRAVFGEPPPSINWDDYAHVTDWGILDQALGEARRKSSTLAERTAFELAYRDAWQRRYEADPSACTEVPGAAALVAEVIAKPAWKCGVATGGTRAAATFKLRVVGIDPAALPGAFANHAISRAAILRNAMQTLGVQASNVVYVGDGRWDVVTCRELGIAFLGVAAEASAEALRAAGAQSIVEDFQDRESFWEAVKHSVPPKQ